MSPCLPCLRCVVLSRSSCLCHWKSLTWILLCGVTFWWL